MTDETLYLIQIEEVDTYTGKRRRYFMRNASDVRKVAMVPLHVARHCVANMGNDFRYRRHASMQEWTRATSPADFTDFAAIDG